MPKAKKDRSRNDKGSILERVVATLHRKEGVKVETNVFLPTLRNPSDSREIDVLITSEVSGYTSRVAIQCKNYKKRITVGQIGDFRDLLDDVGIPHQHGIVVSINGFQKGAVRRAAELGMKTMMLEGLNAGRLQVEVQEALQFFVNLLLVVEQMNMSSPVPDISAWGFWDDDKKFCGFVTDLIVSKWRNGDIPTQLGEYSLDLQIPEGWHQLKDGGFVHPSALSANVRVLAYLAELKGEFSELKLKETGTEDVMRFQMNANFNSVNNLVKATQEEAIFEEAELEKHRDRVKVSMEMRIRLPRIFLRNHLEPISKRTFERFMSQVEGLSLEEIGELPDERIEEIESGSENPMHEPSAIGEPVIITNPERTLTDVRLLFKRGKYEDVIALRQCLKQFPRKDFAWYVAESYLMKGRILLEESVSLQPVVKDALEAQAFTLFENAVQVSPYVETYISLGATLLRTERYLKAIEAFNTASSLDGKNGDARFGKASAEYYAGDREQALATIDAMITEITRIPLATLLFRAELLAEQEDYEKAAADLIHVWSVHHGAIIEGKQTRALVRKVFQEFSVLGIAVIIADIQLYYAETSANDPAEDVTQFLNAAVTILEDIDKTLRIGPVDDFRERSFKQVLNRARELTTGGSFGFSTEEFLSRLDALI